MISVDDADTDTVVLFGCCNNINVELSAIALCVVSVPKGIEPT
jgi:hypothetical protein